MNKYDIFVPAGEKRPCIRIMDRGHETYFCGYDFMGSVDWSYDIGQAARLDSLEEARQIVRDLEAADEQTTSPRSCMGYAIVQALRLDPVHEIVIGHSPTAYAPYVCWDCANGNDYSNGGYCQNYRQALLVMSERIHDRYDDLPREYREEV